MLVIAAMISVIAAFLIGHEMGIKEGRRWRSHALHRAKGGEPNGGATQ